jgi:hypothetical protein
MFRELPTVTLGGTDFIIDLRLEEFRQVTNPFNTISFDELVENEAGYVLCFDTVKKTPFHGDSEEFAVRDAELKVLQLPPLKELDPVGFENILVQIERGLKNGR